MPRTERRRSIRTRLIVATVGLVAAVAALVLGGVYAWTDFAVDQGTDEVVEGELAELVLRHPGPAALAAEILRRSAEAARTRGVYVYAESRLEVIAGNLPVWPADLEAGKAAQDLSLEEGMGELGLVRHVRAASLILDDGRRLLVGRDVTQQEQLQEILGGAALGAFAVALVLAVGGGLAIGRKLLQRVEGMNRTVLRILDGGGGERVPVAGLRDEFDDLAVHFNRLLDENQRLVARMREVTDDVAHDLRTPLARMRRHIESALAAPAEAGRARDALHRLLDETNGVLDTFNALLRISQIEGRSIRQQMAPVYLASIVQDAVDLYQPVAEEAGIALETRLEPGLSVHADRHLLAQAVVNLIDNALKHGDGGGQLEISTRRGEAGVELGVADRGRGIAPDQRERVLQRFVRLDASRNRPGTGLGLSFVAAVADLHGAQLRLEDNAPGLRVTLRFPSQAA